MNSEATYIVLACALAEPADPDRPVRELAGERDGQPWRFSVEYVAMLLNNGAAFEVRMAGCPGERLRTEHRDGKPYVQCCSDSAASERLTRLPAIAQPPQHQQALPLREKLSA